MSVTDQVRVSKDQITAQLPKIADQIIEWFDHSKLPDTFDRDELKVALIGWIEETGIDDIARKYDGHGDENSRFARSLAFTLGGEAARSNRPISSHLSTWVTETLGIQPTASLTGATTDFTAKGTESGFSLS